MDVDLKEVLQRLAGQVGDLTVRLAIAEAQLAAFERAEVDRIAAEEAHSEQP